MSRLPLAAFSRAFSETCRSSLTASERLAIDDGATCTHTPLRSCTPDGHTVHCPMPVHSTQLESHDWHRPVGVEPNWPAGQNVVQMPPIKKGAPECAWHEVQALASIEELQVAHALSHGWQ